MADQEWNWKHFQLFFHPTEEDENDQEEEAQSEHDSESALTDGESDDLLETSFDDMKSKRNHSHGSTDLGSNDCEGEGEEGNVGGGSPMMFASSPSMAIHFHGQGGYGFGEKVRHFSGGKFYSHFL